MKEPRLRHFDLNSLRSFVSICESGSMTHAASQLHLTQSAISMQIKRLEESLELKLLERSPKGMKATHAGEQLLSYARKMLEINDAAWGRLTSPDYEGVIRLGVPADIIHPHIPRVLKDFSRDFPRVQVKLATAITSVLKEEYHGGKHDLVLTTEQQADSGGQIIDRQPLVWVGAISGNAWKKRPLPLGFSTHCAFRPVAIQALEQAGIEWLDIVASLDCLGGDTMTSADLCIAAELKNSSHPERIEIDHNKQLPELPEFSVVMYHTENNNNPLVKSLASYLTHAYQHG